MTDPVGEHGVYHTRWWLYQQIIRVFEQSKRSLPVFIDKHLSTSWDEAKWMDDKSRELNFPLFGGYHAAGAFEHWIIEMMLNRKEPYNSERLLLSTGIVSYTMESNWENGRYSAAGRRVETPFMNISYRSTRGPQFSTGPRPPDAPYIRGFEK